MALEFSVGENPSHFGNHLIIGLSGPSLDDSDKRMLAELRPAGIILFARNFDSNLAYPEWLFSLGRLIEAARYYAERDDIIVSIDHEGGRVHRAPPPITQFPYANSWARRAPEVARAMAIELRSLGVNVSWAPVADIHSNPANPVIGPRALGVTAAGVADAAVPFARALLDNGILPCAKHFPGHGDTAVDSHFALPVVQRTERDLFERELVPFRALIECGVPFVMSAHILFPAIDPGNPATLSPKILGDMLRRVLGFSGVIVSDDLDMKAVAGEFNREETVVSAFTAGCDMFVCARNPDGNTEKPRVLAHGMGKGLLARKITEQSLYDSFMRINRVFEELLPRNEVHELDRAVFAEHGELARELRGGE